MRKIELDANQKKIYNMLLLFCDYCASSLMLFFGAWPMPDDEYICQMIWRKYTDDYKRRNGGRLPQYVKVAGGYKQPYPEKVTETADSVHATIRAFGGYKKFCRQFVTAYKDLSERPKQKRNMQILQDIIKRDATDENTSDIALKYYLTPQQITNIKRRALKAIAINISGQIYSRDFLRKQKGAKANDKTGKLHGMR